MAINTRRRKGRKGPAEPAMKPDACRRIREMLKLTQEQFADQLGVKPLTISLWENGKTPISKNRALSIQGLASRGAA